MQGYWVFVGSSSESTLQFDEYEMENPEGNWDRKHPVIPATPIIQQDNLKNKSGKTNIHFKASEESVSMIGKLIESANHLCMLFASLKDMDDLKLLTLQEKPAERK